MPESNKKLFSSNFMVYQNLLYTNKYSIKYYDLFPIKINESDFGMYLIDHIKNYSMSLLELLSYLKLLALRSRYASNIP